MQKKWVLLGVCVHLHLVIALTHSGPQLLQLGTALARILSRMPVHWTSLFAPLVSSPD